MRVRRKDIQSEIITIHININRKKLHFQKIIDQFMCFFLGSLLLFRLLPLFSNFVKCEKEASGYAIKPLLVMMKTSHH